jgi:hypothetical protein
MSPQNNVAKRGKSGIIVPNSVSAEVFAMSLDVLEGRWEEIRTHDAELVGRTGIT